MQQHLAVVIPLIHDSFSDQTLITFACLQGYAVACVHQHFVCEQDSSKSCR